MLLYKSNNPAVSIVLPTYNRASLLERAIHSLLNQTLNDWELIIADDGSTDSTFELAERLITEHENVRYIKHSHRKLPLTLNAGINAAAGDYISFLGSDDEYHRDYLNQRLEYMKKNPEIDLIHGGVKIIGDPYVKDKNNPGEKIHLSECIIGGTFFGKRSMYLEMKGFKNLDYSEDSDFYERAYKRFRIMKVDLAPYFYYRDTPDSICNTI
jgi:glycosyltransferase involved in cell wall biosynthesis